MTNTDAERDRLAATHAGQEPWYRWGPYLAERQWGTVREDYSADGAAWEYFPHDHARSRAYRWGEDGLLGICDDQQRLCFALALWNERDAILKERLFGLTGPEGNHGEDVKEEYFYLDNTPTHSYMRALYKYPQMAFPYDRLKDENRLRGRELPEFELMDTGIFTNQRYFDVQIEYAKVDPLDLIIRIQVTNRGPDTAPLHLVPTLWYRNTWGWGDGGETKPILRAATPNLVRATAAIPGEYWLACDGAPQLLFTENETNARRLWDLPNPSPFVKDGINDAIVARQPGVVNAAGIGTKCGVHYSLIVAAGASQTILLRLSARYHSESFTDAGAIIARRSEEAAAFYRGFGVQPEHTDAAMVQRQAFAGLLWNKQYYALDIDRWLQGDATMPPPPDQRRQGRNAEWRHLNNADIISMPDTWEYPWYAAWDLAFHCIPLALIDPEFAKQQLILLVREWYMHPNGQLPAYEWAFGDVNPPVHAWAAWRVYKISRRVTGVADRNFLERVFHKLLLNFTWWVNRKDSEGHNIFQGGFLGMDNIGVFDRSAMLPGGGHLEQSDGTAWMGMFCLTMLSMALELARENRAYEDVATKFFEHFLYIAQAMNNIADRGIGLWDETDAFFYDVLHTPDDQMIPLKVRSLVGLMPLVAVETIEPDLLDLLPDFRARLQWFLTHRPDLANLVSTWQDQGMGKRHLLTLVRGHRLKRLLTRMLDPEEFLSEYGIRSISKYHAEHPFTLQVQGHAFSVRYDPAESTSGLFGGNSNWRGPIWFPINYLLIESLQKFHHYYGDDFLVEAPTGSGQTATLGRIATDLSRRLCQLFLQDEQGQRPIFGADALRQNDPHWKDHVLFYEYFHGDTGRGVGASHQTGWTALVAKLLEQTGPFE